MTMVQQESFADLFESSMEGINLEPGDGNSYCG